MRKSGQSISINDINKEFSIEVVELSEKTDLDDVITNLNDCLNLLVTLKETHIQAQALVVDWEGQTKEIYDELSIFQERFINDMSIAIKSYKESIEVVRNKMQ
jgi:hypothetical protein